MDTFMEEEVLPSRKTYINFNFYSKPVPEDKRQEVTELYRDKFQLDPVYDENGYIVKYKEYRTRRPSIVKRLLDKKRDNDNSN